MHLGVAMKLVYWETLNYHKNTSSCLLLYGVRMDGKSILLYAQHWLVAILPCTIDCHFSIYMQIYKEKIQQISREHLALKSEFDGQLSGLEWYPPSMSYKVCYKGETQPYPELDCWIEAQGAVTVTGSPPSFNVTPTAINEMEGTRSFATYYYSSVHG